MLSQKRRPVAGYNLETLFHRCLRDLTPHIRFENVMKIKEKSLISWDPFGLVEILEDLSSSAEKHGGLLEYAALRQLLALLSKNPSLPGTSQESRKANALQKFHASENHCRDTNVRLANLSLSELSPLLGEVISESRWFIYKLLGGVPEPKEIWAGCTFGPGMTFGSKFAEHAHLYHKVAGPHTATRRLTDDILSLPSFARYFPLWVSTLVDENATYDVVGGNRVTTVPKTAVTDRTIAIEPSLNMFVQKGIESALTRRLRKYVDLSSQLTNRYLAKSISCVRNPVATIDLSSASDLISIEAVRLLLPSDWFTLLDSCRSEYYQIGKGDAPLHRYEKFSSMGNAFTFPLETLIFYAIARSCTIVSGGNLEFCSAYGDDIIIDSSAALLLCEALDFLGFKVNTEKSYFFGYFRETCGVDLLGGFDTRPVYLKSHMKSDVDVYNFFNRLLANRVGFRFESTLEYLHSLVERPFYGPRHLAPGVEWYSWYDGKSSNIDGYFHSPSFVADRFKRYCPETQRSVWHIQSMQKLPRKYVPDDLRNSYWYLAFLRGLGGQRLESVSQFKIVPRHQEISWWPDDFDWPSFFYCLSPTPR